MSIEVKLKAFEGPLELLLHLIDKNKVNIYDIPILQITEQYLEYLHRMEELDLHIMSEFLVMAATLIHIKSRMLLPKNEKEEEDEGDPRQELVNRLIEYKMYQYAAEELRGKEVDAQKVMFKSKDIPYEVSQYKEKIDPTDLLNGITLQQLNQIFQSVMKRQVEKIDPIRSKFGKIEKEEVSVSDKMKEIRERILGLSRISFSTLLSIQASKVEVVVTFLAVLELIKMGTIKVTQEDMFDDIILNSTE